MENKLQELTRKIYSEGVEKASQEAAHILGNAQKEADAIVKRAKKEAEDIVNEAKKSAEELQRHAGSEIRMSSKQAISAIRQQIGGLITARVVDAPVKETLSDKAFIGELIRKAMDNFSENAALILPASDEKKLEVYFGSRLNQVLASGIDIRFDDQMRGGFRIGPADNSYVISFTDEDFEAFFRSFMRPRTIKLLFGGE